MRLEITLKNGRYKNLSRTVRMDRCCSSLRVRLTVGSENTWQGDTWFCHHCWISTEKYSSAADNSHTQERIQSIIVLVHSHCMSGQLLHWCRRLQSLGFLAHVQTMGTRTSNLYSNVVYRVPCSCGYSVGYSEKVMMLAGRVSWKSLLLLDTHAHAS